MNIHFYSWSIHDEYYSNSIHVFAEPYIDALPKYGGYDHSLLR